MGPSELCNGTVFLWYSAAADTYHFAIMEQGAQRWIFASTHRADGAIPWRA